MEEEREDRESGQGRSVRRDDAGAESQEKILNLTQHKATPEQVAQGVVEMNEDWKRVLVQLLTFEELPDSIVIRGAAENIAALAEEQARGARKAMIGGAPFLMAPLEKALKAKGIVSVYAFSKRVSVEEVKDGKVTKTSVFKHIGFVEVNE